MAHRASQHALALLATLIAGCSARDVSLYLPIPEHEGLASMLVAVERDGSATLVAADLTSGAATITIPAPVLGTGDAATFSALLYRDGLAALKLEAGTIPAASAAEESPRAIPTPDAKWVTDVDLASADAPAWRPLGALSRTLEDFRMPPAKTPCAQFDVEIHDLETQGTGMFLVEIDASTVLAGTRIYANGMDTTKLWRLDRDGSHREVDIYDEPLGQLSTAPFLGMYSDGDDLWLGGIYGELDRASWDGERVVIHERFMSPAGGSVHWITGRSGMQGTDLYLLTIHGAFSRFDGRRFQLLHQFDLGEMIAWRGGLAYVGPGEAVAVVAFNPTAIRVKDGVVREELVPDDGALHTVTEVPVLGTIIGTSEGQFLHWRAGAWEHMPGSKLTVWNLGIHPYEDGFVFSGAFDNFGQYKVSYDQEEGFCPVTLPTGFEGLHFAVLGDDLMMIGENPNVPRTPYAIFRRRR